MSELSEFLAGDPEKALNILFDYSQYDGGHHKAWAVDQAVRALTGDKYDEFVRYFCDGEYGPDTYEWDEGIAP